MENQRNVLLYILYGVTLLAVYPIIEFEIYRHTEVNESVSDFSYWFRLLFSGPILIAIGLLLVWLYMKVHKILGILSIGIGVYWLIVVSNDIISEIWVF